MKKLLIISFLTAFACGYSQIYKAKDGTTEVSFFSKAPLEDITALNKGAIIVLNNATNAIQIRISMINFKFKNGLMEEHFNENYLETEKYPNAVFKGTIKEGVDMNKTEEQKVTVSGTMDLHGVQKEVVINGTVKVANGEITISSEFKIKVADYNIKVPSMYVKNIAEIVDVSLKSTLEPFKKN